MNLQDRIILLNEFAAQYIDDEDLDLQNFFKFNNLGIPFAIGITNEYIKLEKAGEFILEESWQSLCDFLDIDPDDEYENIYDLIESSNFVED